MKPKTSLPWEDAQAVGPNTGNTGNTGNTNATVPH